MTGPRGFFSASGADRLLVGPLQSGPGIAGQPRACADEQSADASARAVRPGGAVMGAPRRLTSAAVFFEKIIVSGLGKDPKEFGVHGGPP